MRKWMRERLKRRKQSDAGTSQEKAKAPQPLQPKYFDNEAPETETPRADVEPEPQQEPAAEAARSRPQSPGSKRPTRRRRGRGGRGRASKAQPAAAKPATPELQSVEIEPAAPPEPVMLAEPEAMPPPEAALPQPVSAAVRSSKGTVVLAIGLPGSGKSSWFKRHNIRPLSSDLLRQLLFDDAEEQRFQDLVFINLRSMLKARLIAKRPMNYVDATNLTPHDRRNWIKLAKDFGYDVQGVFFDVPLEVCLERNHKRSRTVSDDVMRRMAAKLRPPTFDEGFSKITVVRVKKQEQQP
jgi:predicted kinase